MVENNLRDDERVSTINHSVSNHALAKKDLNQIQLMMILNLIQVIIYFTEYSSVIILYVYTLPSVAQLYYILPSIARL